ncbi:MAG: RagB/SusD family nutrient uptake outer membrane protein, partial [Chitinophagaceae bacterium]
MKLINNISPRVLLLFLLLTTTITGCKKYLEVPPPIDQLATDNVFKTKPTIISAVNGMYNAFSDGLLKGTYYKITYWWSDEGEISPLPGSEIGDIIGGNIVPANTQLMLWVFFYRTIFRANSLIEKLPSVGTDILTDAEKKQFIAAAKYIRAAEHFTLVNSWGDVPLITSTSADDNLNKPRTPASEVFNQIIKDLQEAAADLPATVNTSNSKTIHNKFQPLALLAKVYLYLGRWAEAEAAATEVIGSNQYLLVTGVNNVFKRGSREAILSHGATGIGSLFDNRAVLGWITLPASSGNAASTHCAIPTTMLSRFEAGDQRNVSGNWTISLFGKVFANKYLHNSAATTTTISANPQDFIYQRLAELYLIRAEA